LVAQWVQALADERFGTTQVGSSGTQGAVQRFNFGDPTARHFDVAFATDTEAWSVDIVVGFSPVDVQAILDEAIDHANRDDTGEDVVFQTEFTTRDFELNDKGFSLHFMRVLGDQVRITGRRRLSDRVLLEFVEDPIPEGVPILLAPKTKISIKIFVPGPVTGPLARLTAESLADVVCAICTFAMGRVVAQEFPMIFPATEEDTNEARAIRHDPSIPGLARNGVSLDIFGDLPARAGVDGVLRARGSLLAYQAALEQRHPDVAFMLLVTAIEALIAPRPPWGKDKVTKRFIRATEELCPGTVDAVVGHENVNEAFGIALSGSPRRRRRDVLDTMYSIRSLPTHSGLSPSATGALFNMAGPGGMRVALASDVARDALLAYLVAPRSFLQGHPTIDPATSPD
jgi:hypothetical protein